MVPVTSGIALTFKIRREPRVALAWVGDGSTKTAAAHEGTNFAAVQKLPAIFIIQNNQVALGTRLDQHHLPGRFDDWAGSYGIAGAAFDGNNVLDAYAATRLAAERCRRGEGPVLLVAETFRMGGHATHDEREARDTLSAALFEHWGKRDPIGMYEEYLKADGITGEAARGDRSGGSHRSRRCSGGGRAEPREDAAWRECARWCVREASPLDRTISPQVG